MKVIALVGGSGTGKSTIARHLVAKGAEHLDTDRIGHMLLDDDEVTRDKIKNEFGDDVFGEDGTIDRKILGKRVFADKRAIEALNGILHPAILNECARRIEEAEKGGIELIVIDAALLLEVEIPMTINCIIALRCDRSEQIRRLEAPGTLGKDDIEARLNNQTHLEKSFHKADIVLDTSGELESVLAKIDAIVARVLVGK